jgi:hypothetical protein
MSVQETDAEPVITTNGPASEENNNQSIGSDAGVRDSPAPERESATDAYRRWCATRQRPGELRILRNGERVNR